MSDKSRVGFFEGIFNPERLRAEAHANKPSTKLQEYKLGYQNMMNKRYVEEHQEEDFTGTPFEAMDKEYDRKVDAQFPISGGKGSASNYAKRKGKEQNVKDPTTKLGATGVVPIGDPYSRKDQTLQKIMEKPERERTKFEHFYVKRAMGVSDSSKGPKKPEDHMRIRKLAKDMAKSEAIEAVGPEAVDGFVASESQIQEKVVEATKYLYPKTKVEEVDGEGLKRESLDIKLPSGITKTSQALKFLAEQGMDEAESREWLRSRMRQGAK